MPKVTFQPNNETIEVDSDTKILVAGVRAKTNIRYGCSACRCGTCGVKVQAEVPQLSPMSSDENDLLKKMGLPLDGSVRLACQTRVVEGDVSVDLTFQDTYSPDDRMDEDFL